MEQQHLEATATDFDGDTNHLSPPPESESSRLLNLKAYHQDHLTHKENLLVLNGSTNGRKLKILIDSGANPSFINSDLDFIELQTASNDIQIRLANGKIISSSGTATLDFSMDQLQDSHNFIAAPIAYDLILGIDWLRKLNPQIDWISNILTIGNKKISATTPHRPVEVMTGTAFKRMLPRVMADKDGMIYQLILTTEPAAKESTLRTTTAAIDADDAKLLENLPSEIGQLYRKFTTVFQPFEGMPPSRSH